RTPDLTEQVTWCVSCRAGRYAGVFRVDWCSSVHDANATWSPRTLFPRAQLPLHQSDLNTCNATLTRTRKRVSLRVAGIRRCGAFGKIGHAHRWLLQWPKQFQLRLS